MRSKSGRSDKGASGGKDPSIPHRSSMPGDASTDRAELFRRDEFGQRTGIVPPGGWPHTTKLGGTSLIFLPQLARQIGVPSLAVKLEGENVTSTHKARAAAAHAFHAKTLGMKEISVGSCGNYGEAIAYFAARADLKCTVFLPAGNEIDTVRTHLVQCGARVQEVEGGYAQAVAASQQYALAGRRIYDANSGGRNGDRANADVDREAYAQIAYEIVEDLGGRGQEPGVVLAPAGNGTLGMGLSSGFKACSLNPRLILSTASNPLLKASQSGSRRCEEIDESEVRVSHLTEAVAGTVALDGDAALRAVRSSSGKVLSFSDPFLQRAEKLIESALRKERQMKVDILPIAAAGLASLLEHPRFIERHLREHPDKRVFIIVVTGEVD